MIGRMPGRPDRTVRALAAAGIALAALGLAACTAGAPAPSPTRSPAPVIDQDFPDPDVVHDGDGWVAFATNRPGADIQVATSPDLRRWTVLARDALAELPAWATSGRTWAPDVSRDPAGGWVMYFAAEDSSGKQCLGVAKADAVRGPYRPASPTPVVCPLSEGGAIDPDVVTDAAGTRYLVWKTDGNCCDLDTWIELAPLAADGLTVTAAPTRLIKQTLTWEGNLVEAPTLVQHGSGWALLYSANDYANDRYAIGVATAPAITGPYTKQHAPLLSSSSSDGLYRGPGGQDVVAGPHGDVLVFHSWDPSYAYRAVQTLPMRWRGGVPEVVLPSR